MTPETACTAQFFEEHKLRMSSCFWLATFPYDSPPDDLADALWDSLDQDDMQRLFPRAEIDLRDVYEIDDTPSPKEILAAVVTNGYLGFLVCVESPTESHGTWSSYSMHWGYGESLRDAIKGALHQIDDIRARRWDIHEPVAALYGAAA